MRYIKMDEYDIDSIRDRLRSYYGTAAVVLGNEDPFMGYAAATECFDVDDLNDEEVISKAQSLGII